jgi:NAD(P)H-dependent FMN reductase
MLHLQVVVVSTRPGRIGPFVASWFMDRALAHGKFDVELVSLADANLPLLDEPRHPMLGQFEHEHTKAWSATISRGDAYVFVTPEYDYSTPAAFMNALQCLSKEWAYKAAGFVSYGGVSGGLRSVQMAKQLVTSLRMMPIPEGVAIPFVGQFLDRETGQFTPAELQTKAAPVMLDELLKWATALRPLRPA